MINFCKVWLKSIIFFCLAQISFSGTLSAFKNSNADSTDLVVAVAGYQQMRKHASGIDVPVFSLDVNLKDRGVTAILFSIVAPTNYAEHVFWVECPKNEGFFDDQRYSPDIMFPKDKLFSIPLSDSNIQLMLKSASHMNPKERLSTWHLPIHPYFVTLESALSYAEKKKEILKRYMSELPNLQKRLSAERNEHVSGERKSDLYKELSVTVGDMIHEIVQIKSDIKDVEKQIARLKKVEAQY